MTVSHESPFDAGHVCQSRSADWSLADCVPKDIRHREVGDSNSWLSTFLRPFAPPELPGFVATMNALTPERRCSRNRARAHRPVRSGLLVSRFRLSGHSVSNHPLSSSKFGLVSLRDLPSSRIHHPTHPLGRVPHDVTWASPLASRLTTTTGRIEFVSLRTNHSPPVAPHPVSRRRSFVRIQSSNPTLMRTRTSLT